jgi:hypothetical protein
MMCSSTRADHGRLPDASSKVQIEFAGVGGRPFVPFVFFILFSLNFALNFFFSKLKKLNAATGSISAHPSTPPPLQNQDLQMSVEPQTSHVNPPAAHLESAHAEGLLTVSVDKPVAVAQKPKLVNNNEITLAITITKEDFYKSSLAEGSLPLKVVEEMSEFNKWIMFRHFLKSKQKPFSLLSSAPLFEHLTKDVWNEVAEQWSSTTKEDAWKTAYLAEKTAKEDAEVIAKKAKEDAEMAELIALGRKAKADAEAKAKADAEKAKNSKTKNPKGNKCMTKEDVEKRDGITMTDEAWAKRQKRMETNRKSSAKAYNNKKKPVKDEIVECGGCDYKGLVSNSPTCPKCGEIACPHCTCDCE